MLHAARSSRPRLTAVKLENLRRLDEDVRLRRTTFLGKPDVVSLLTTEVCNLRCIMCPRATKLGTRRLDRAVLARVLDEVFPTTRKAIVSPHHGEPLAADFDLVLERALAHDVKLDVVTNGLLLTPEVYAHAAHALDCVNVSIDAVVPEVYERVRAGGRFERLARNLEGIARLRRAARDGVTLSFSAVVMRSTEPHLERFLTFAAEHAADAVILQPLRHFHKTTAEEALDARTPRDTGCSRVDPAALAARLERLGARAQELGINLYFNDFALPGVEPRRLRRKVENVVDPGDTCWFVARNFGVLFTGDVYPCCYPTDHALGNVERESVDAVWNGGPLRRLREAHFSRRGTAFCNGCLHAPYLPAKKDGAHAFLRAARLLLRSAGNGLARRFAS